MCSPRREGARSWDEREGQGQWRQRRQDHQGRWSSPAGPRARSHRHFAVARPL
jgi:hypothetical protein